jgi:iron complex transport system ATP-binding protein
MTALAVQGLRVALGGKPVLDSIDLTIDGPGVIGIIGPNGAGKTTLMRCLAGLAATDHDAVRFDDRPLMSLPARDRAKRIGYLPQSPSLHWPLSVGRLVALGRLPHLAPWSPPQPADAQAIERALKATDLTGFTDRPAHSLSGGELARALLARVIAGEPDIILADEPIAALDPLHQLRILALFRHLANSGRTVVLVLHDLALAMRYCDRLMLLDHGRIAADGAPGALANSPALTDAFGVGFARPTWRGETVLVPWQPVDER